MGDVLVPVVNALIVLDADGERLLAKYYDGRAKSEQTKLEQFLHKKTKTAAARADTEVLLNDSEVVVFRAGQECKFFLSSCSDENELVLAGVLDAIFEAVSQLLRSQVDKRTMLDNLELILLTIDEAIDHGHIMELDPHAIVSRVLMRGSESTAGSGAAGGQPDLSISQAFGIAREQFMRTMTSSTSRGDGY